MIRLSKLACAALAVAFAGCNGILGIEKASPIGSDASVGGQGGGGGGSGGTGATASGGSGGLGAGGGSGGGAAGASGGAAGSDAGPCVQTDTDAKNCGWCGHDCKGTACNGGLCVPTELTAIDFGSAFAITSDSIFVGTELNNLYKVPKNGGSVETWAGKDDLYYVLAQGSNVYFTEYNPHLIYSVPTTGALTPKSILTANSSLNGMTVDSTGIYFAEYDTSILRRAALDGTGPVDFVTNAVSAWHLATDATDLYFDSVNDGIYRLAKNTTPLPANENNVPYFYDIPGPGPVSMSLDGNFVYFSTGDPTYIVELATTQVRRISKDKSKNEVLAESTTLVFGITVADGYAYWVEEGTLQNDFTDGAVRRVKLDTSGAQPETLAEKQRHPLAIAVDGEWLYWLNGGWTGIAGSVSRIAR